eukprot:TRINITY_DN5222_c0_g1_i1.p1 TRINITY_DN5222_c0_g1~~TRINITY_DN5222_c0_g1_i1.p1  ORF type:complete len:707 (+),score=272.77 TRINITY_DN5222_c0_g1_i1:193-2313(+)
MSAPKSEESKVTVELGRGSGGIEAARNIATGTIPSNEVMLDSLTSAQKSVHQQGESLNGQGSTLAKDTERVLEATKNLIIEKNSDQMLQQVLLQSKSAAETGAQTGQKSETKSQAKTVGGDLTQSARELATLLGQSREMRGLLMDQFQTFQRLFWDRMQSKEGSVLPPSYGQSTTGYSGGHALPSSGLGLGQGRYYSYDTGFTDKPVAAYGISSTGAVSTTSDGSLPASSTAAPSLLNVGTAVAPGMDARTSGFVESQRPGYGQTSGDFQQIVLTPEEKRELVNSWRTLLTQLGAKPNYGRAMDQIFLLFDHLSELKDNTASDPDMKQAGRQGNDALYGVKDLAERFMGEKDLERLIQLFRELVNFTTENPEIRRFGSDWRDFASETMKQPELLNDDRYTARMEELVDRTVHWMNVPYFRTQSRAIADELKEIFNAIKEDPSLNEVQDSFSTLFKNLAMDSNGNVSISQLTSSIPHLKNLLAPILIDQFNCIPINRVYGSTPKYDFELSNIVLSASDLVPDRFFLDVHTKAKVGLSSDSADQMATRLKLKVSNITASMKNVNFYYLRKKLPKIEDEGVVNVSVLAPGASIKIVWEISSSEKRPLTVNFRKATCDIGNLKVDVVKAKHSILDKMATKLFAGQMKHRIETAVSDGLSSVGNGLSDRMNRAVRHKPQPKSDVKVGVDAKNASATISNTNDATPSSVGRV